MFRPKPFLLDVEPRATGKSSSVSVLVRAEKVQSGFPHTFAPKNSAKNRAGFAKLHPPLHLVVAAAVLHNGRFFGAIRWGAGRVKQGPGYET